MPSRNSKRRSADGVEERKPVGLRSDLELNYKIEEQTMARGPLNEGEIKRYHEDGFVLVRGMFDRQEIEMLHASAKDDKALDDHAFDRADDQGGVVRLSLWNHPSNGIYGMFARCRSLVDSAEALLGGEVYHYHSKMIMKEPKVGGAWAWHQDYGYWYQNGVLFPLLTSAFIAVDRATKENGCLQVLKGSHLAGRVDHVLTGEQAGADPFGFEEAGTSEDADQFLKLFQLRTDSVCERRAQSVY